MYVLLGNPGVEATTATVTFLLADGTTVDRTYAVPARRRLTCSVETLRRCVMARVRSASLATTGWVISKRRPLVVIGVGGYSSGPVVLLAAMRGIPTLLMEQNATPGLTNRLLSRLVRTAGALRCIVSTTDGNPKSLVAKARNTPSTAALSTSTLVPL